MNALKLFSKAILIEVDPVNVSNQQMASIKEIFVNVIIAVNL